MLEAASNRAEVLVLVEMLANARFIDTERSFRLSLQVFLQYYDVRHQCDKFLTEIRASMYYARTFKHITPGVLVVWRGYDVLTTNMAAKLFTCIELL